MVHPIHSGLANLPTNLAEASYSLGKSSWTTLFRVLLPNIKPALLTGIVLAFAHTVGEFGVVLMIGGNIPGETRVISIAIYESVEKLDYYSAHILSGGMIIASFLMLLITFHFKKQKKQLNNYD